MRVVRSTYDLLGWGGFLTAPSFFAMIFEAILAYAHILAILMMTTFLASETAMCRKDWMNAAIIERLVLVDMLYGVSALAVLLTGLARTWWGVKGGSWYWSQPLLHAKVTVFVLVLGLSLVATRRYLRWRKAVRTDGTLPPEQEIRSTRRIVMVAAHVVAIVPLLAVFLARGVGTR